jgi:hypothetical protein
LAVACRGRNEATSGERYVDGINGECANCDAESGDDVWNGDDGKGAGENDGVENGDETRVDVERERRWWWAWL